MTQQIGQLNGALHFKLETALPKGLYMRFFTICAENYFAQAITMADSLKKTSHTTIDIDIWVLDNSRPLFESSNFNVINTQKHIPHFESLALRYNVLELSTALKPYIFMHYITKHQRDDFIIYLDPDLYFLGDITKIISGALEASDYALTPHIKSPIPKDGKRPSDKDILASGTFNLGFLALKLNKTTTRPLQDMIAWWASWLEKECWSDPQRGVFTDQKWINLAITMWQSYTTINDDGLNVAYWNLHERRIIYTDGVFRVNDTPLVFFHFSGFIPQEMRLSKHENRIGLIPEDTALFDLALIYTESLKENDYSYYSKQPLKYITSPSGGRLDRVCQISFQTYDNSPQDKPFWEWLSDADNFGFTNYELAFLSIRKDVIEHFKSQNRFTRDNIRDWLINAGINEENLSEDILRYVGVLDSLEVTYCGYLTAQSGVADAARSNINALTRTGVMVSCIDVSDTTNLDIINQTERAEIVYDPLTDDNLIRIVHVNADSLPVVKRKLPALFNKYIVCYWAWELEQFPSYWYDRDMYVDEIWVPSTFVKKSIEKIFKDKPIYIVPHSITIDVDKLIDRKVIFKKLKIPDRFTFFVSFDMCSCIERKNPEDAISAFLLSFKDNVEAQLVVKISNSDKCDTIDHMVSMHRTNKNIIFLLHNMDELSYLSLLNSVDCYVSLHKSEGFGLNIAQAMYLGKPVIVTAYGGNMDFCNSDNSFLVPYEKSFISKSWNDYRRGYIWAKPIVSEAAKYMHHVFYNPDTSIAKGKNAANYVRENLSLNSVGKIMQYRIYSIYRKVSPMIKMVSDDAKNNSYNDDIISILYRSLLIREADDDGLIHYTNMLNKHGYSRVVADILLSHEFGDKHKLNSISRFLLKLTLKL